MGDHLSEAVVAGIHRGDDAAAAGDITDKVTHVFIRSGQLNLHDRLKKLDSGLLGSLFERHGSGDLERHFVGVYRVITSVDDLDFEVHHRITGENTAGSRFADTVFDRLDVFLRNVTADNFVLNGDTCSAFLRDEVDNAVTILTASTGLTDEAHITVGFFLQSFTVSNLRCTGIGFDLELTDQTVENDLQVQLSHTGNDGLPGIFITVDLEGGIFFSQSEQTLGQLVTVAGALGLDSNRDNRFGEGHGFQRDRTGFETESITGGHVTQTDCGGNITGEDLFTFLTAVGVHLKQTSETLGFAGTGVVNRHTLCRNTGINTQIVKFTHKRVGHDLEHESTEGLHIADMTGDFIAGDRIGSLDVPDIQRTGQIPGDRIKQRLDTLVLEGGGSSHRNNLTRQSGTTESSTQFFHGRDLVFEIDFHYCIIGFRQSFHQIVEGFFLFGFLICIKLLDILFGSVILAMEIDRLTAENVDHTAEISFFADRQVDRKRIGTEFVADIINHTLEVSTGTVHLVDQGDDRNTVFLGLTPHGFTLGLNFTHGAEHGNRTVKHTETALHLSGEVHVSRSVDDIDAVTFPETGGSSTGNGDTAFLLLFHPVHGGSTFMGIADLVVASAIKEDTFGKSGFTGVDVRHDTDVTDIGKTHLTSRTLIIILLIVTHDRL